MDIATQIYTILKQPDAEFLTQVIYFVLWLYSSPFMFFIQNVKYLLQPSILLVN
jgi:hypothetical protein